jgi:hypothetical protein
MGKCQCENARPLFAFSATGAFSATEALAKVALKSFAKVSV